jgi:large subunit ribosomal protein L10
MEKTEKNQVIDGLAEQLNNNGIFYLADTSELTVEATNNLRRNCFKNNVSLTVVKNTLLFKAMEKLEADGKDFGDLKDLLSGPTSIMFAEVGNAPAKVIKDFRRKHEKPVLKGAFVEEAIYIGDDQLEALTNIKSKEELLGELIGLLQSPAKNVVSALQSSKNTLAGLMKTLSERES